MKMWMILALLLAGCSCDKEDDDFSPFPGGKTQKIDLSSGI
jgi:hypothetical protein